MSLVPAKCPECGGDINIDQNKKVAICEFCKQPFIVEEAINKFNTIYNITNNNETAENLVKKFEFYKKRLQNNEKNRGEEFFKIAEILEEFRINYSEKYPDNIDYQIQCFSMILECSYMVLDGYTMPKKVAGIGILEKYCDIINYINPEKGKIIRKKLNIFIQTLNEYTFKEINEEASLTTLYKSKFNSSCDVISPMTRDVMIAGFIKYGNGAKYYPSMEEIFNEIRKSEFDEIRAKIDCIRKNARWSDFFLYELVGLWGHYFVVKNFDNNLFLGKCSECFTTKENFIKYVKKMKEEYYNTCQLKGLCSSCLNKLSTFGKCKNKKCKYYNKKVFQ